MPPQKKAGVKKGVTIPKSRSKKANEEWTPTARDQIAVQIVAGMLGERWAEVRRRPDQQKIVSRAYELADVLIETSQGNS